MIICLLGAFFENALKKQNPPLSSLSMHCACMSGGKLCPFFKPAAPCMLCFGGSAFSRLGNLMVTLVSLQNLKNVALNLHYTKATQGVRLL